MKNCKPWLTLIVVGLMLLPRPVQAFGRPAVRVYGSDLFKHYINDTLDFMWAKDPDDYLRTVHFISYIEENWRRDQPWTYIVGDNGTCKVEVNLINNLNITDLRWQLAGNLVHEGSLCHDYWTGNTADVRADEIAALKIHRHFFVRSGAPQYLIAYMDQLIAQNAPYLR